MKVRVTLAVLLALFAILTLLERFVLIELLVRRAAVPMLVVIAEALAILGVGALMRRTKRVDVPVDFLIGYPVFGALCFLVGLLKISAWTMVPLLVIFGLGGVALLLMRFAEEERGAGVPPASRGASHAAVEAPAGTADAGGRDARRPVTLGFLAVITVLACGFIAAQAPPSSLDEVAYHLAVPHTWVLEGRAVELPLLSHSYFPLGIESADLPLLTMLGATSGGIASHFLHLLAALATALLIVRRTGSWLAAAAIVTTPALAITAGWSLVDWPLAGLFVVLWIALEDDDRHTASAATAAGMLVKYTFLPFAILAWAFKRRIPSWVVAVGLIFFVRNAILTGNPVAPFFGGDAPHVSGYRELALSDYIFEGSFIDESIGASLLILAPFAAGAIPLASLVAGVALFFLAPSSRILVPFFVIPALSAAPVLKRKLIAALVVIAVVIQTFLVVWFTGRGNAFSLLAGSASEEEFLTKQRASHSAIAWLDATLPAKSRTLVVGVNETYWFTKPVRGAGNFDGPRLSHYFDVHAPDALRDRLRRDGISHVAIVSVPIATKDATKREERQVALTPPAQKMLVATLDRYSANVTSRGNAALFTLK